MQDNFFQWVHTEEQLGKITFQVKGGTPEQQQGLEADQAQGRSNIVPFSRSRCASDSQHHAGDFPHPTVLEWYIACQHLPYMLASFGVAIAVIDGFVAVPCSIMAATCAVLQPYSHELVSQDGGCICRFILSQ